MQKEFLDAEDMASTSTENSDGNKSENFSPNVDVFKVGVRVPPFWPEEPEIWFAQIEGQFAIAGITKDSTKFYYVIGQLDNSVSREVKDIITKPPSCDMYEKLKSELIKRLTASKENKLKQLLMHEELGDRKPSQFLRHLSGLAGSGFPEDVLKTMWISRLSHGIQTVLAGQPTTSSLDVLADLADRVSDLAPHRPSVSSMAQAHPSSTSDLAKEVAELRSELMKIRLERNNRSHTPVRDLKRSRSRGRSSSRSKRSESNHRKYPLCWYHFQFGERASKCILPCDYSAGNAKGGR